jgi:hypothetical protein
MQNCIASLLDCIRLRTGKNPLGRRPSRPPWGFCVPADAGDVPVCRAQERGERKQSDCRRRGREWKLGSSVMRRRVSLHVVTRQTRGTCSPTSGERGPLRIGKGLLGRATVVAARLVRST